MKTEEEILSDFWTEKVNRLKNVLRYGAPAFDLDFLYDSLLQNGFTPERVKKTSTRSFFGNECPSLSLNLCREADATVVQNTHIGTLDLTIQACREPVSLTGASIASVLELFKTYIAYFPRYQEAIDRLTSDFRTAAKEEAQRQKLKKVALTGIRLLIHQLFADTPYHPYLKTEETHAILAVRLQSGKTLEIKLSYADFQKSVPLIAATLAHMEQATATSPLPVNLTDTDYWS